MTEYVGPLYQGRLPENYLRLVETLDVLRSSSINPANLGCLNVIGGFNIVIQTSGLIHNQTLLIVATGGVAATLRLDSGGLVAGQSVYTLKPGTLLTASWDGTNLN